MKYNKKAIAPLVSTVILIMFATVLGLIVMSWGQSVNASEDLSCKDSGLRIVDFKDKSDVCDDGTRIKLTLQNTGIVSVDGYKIIIMGEDGIYDSIIEKRIGPADVSIENIKYEDVDNILKIELVPIINGNLCIKSLLEIEGIDRC